MFTVLTVAAWVIGFYVVLALSVFIFQPLLVYKPNKERKDPKDIGLDQVDEVVLDSIDGQKLIAWYTPAQPGFPTILYFHGRSGSLANRRDRIHRMTRRGYGVFMPSYRSYSGSTGKPSQGALTLDALTAYDYLQAQGVPTDKIVIYGESLGTALATPVASSRDCAALILEAPFTALSDAAASRFPMLPVKQFMHDSFETSKIIDRVNAPLLILHGGKDKVVPIEFGRKMFDLANEPKEMVEFKTAGHSGMFMMGAFSKIHDFLQRHVAIPGSAVTPFKKSAAE